LKPFDLTLSGGHCEGVCPRVERRPTSAFEGRERASGN
jgi:hypothetical protein